MKNEIDKSDKLSNLINNYYEKVEQQNAQDLEKFKESLESFRIKILRGVLETLDNKRLKKVQHQLNEAVELITQMAIDLYDEKTKKEELKRQLHDLTNKGLKIIEINDLRKQIVKLNEIIKSRDGELALKDFTLKESHDENQKLRKEINNLNNYIKNRKLL